MKKSEIQTEEHNKNYEKYRQVYIEGKEGKKSLEGITTDKRRCVTLVHEIEGESTIYALVSGILDSLREKILGLYVQEIPHFTIDCHRYVKEPVEGQKIITPEEFRVYDQMLKEEIGQLSSFPFSIRGVSFGGRWFSCSGVV